MDQEGEICAKCDKVIHVEEAVTLLCPKPPARDQAAKIAPALAGFRKRGDGKAGVEHDPCARDQARHVQYGGGGFQR